MSLGRRSPCRWRDRCGIEGSVRGMATLENQFCKNYAIIIYIYIYYIYIYITYIYILHIYIYVLCILSTYNLSLYVNSKIHIIYIVYVFLEYVYSTYMCISKNKFAFMKCFFFLRSSFFLDSIGSASQAAGLKQTGRGSFLSWTHRNSTLLSLLFVLQKVRNIFVLPF